MAIRWEKVYVFISSTFNDMHAERDHLVKQVFPQLAEWCEKRKLRLVDIDLRWGVTEQDATENKRVVQVCLERIDACRPFFLCFLGQRRGWVPARNDISPETYLLYPELGRYAGDASVTELEILHALVDPLHRGKVPFSSGNEGYKPAEHSFFYLREPGYLKDIPAENTSLRQVYTNEGISDAQARSLADQELERWRTLEVAKTGRPVHPYQASWDLAGQTPEIRIPLSCPSSAQARSPGWQLAYEQWKNRWAQAGVQVDQNGGISDPQQQQKAAAHNASLERGRLSGFVCGQATLAETVLADLMTAITTCFPGHVETAEVHHLQRELDQQAQFLQVASEGFIERGNDFTTLDEYCQGQANRPFFLTAPGGLGKTSLLASWIDRWQARGAAGESLHYRFIGASDHSTTSDGLLRSVLGELKEMDGKITQEIPPEPEGLRAALPALLEEAGKKGKTILVLDGLNQLETSLSDTSWLPALLPAGIKLITSFKRGEPRAEALYKKLQVGGQSILAEVKPFESLDDRRKLVNAYLSQYLKELDDPLVEALIQSEGASNPLFLKVVLAELRIFGAFTDLGQKIRDDFGETPVSAFLGMLRRLEKDPAYSSIPSEILVPRIFGWLAHARTGLRVEELSELLMEEKVLPDSSDKRRLAEEAVHGLLRQVRPYLAHRSGQVGFFYESLQLAVTNRYGRERSEAAEQVECRPAQTWHASLARYFTSLPLRLVATGSPNQRKLSELAFQLAHAGMAEPLYRTLMDYAYIQARMEGGNIGSLIDDYELARAEAVHVGKPEKQCLSLLQKTFRLCAHILQRDTGQLPSQLLARLIDSDEEGIRMFLEQVRTETVGAWLQPISECLERPGQALLRTLGVDTGGILSVALAANGEVAISGNGKSQVKVWDLMEGRELRTLTGHTLAVNGVALSADGSLAVSASSDKTLKAWDVASGSELHTLTGHTGEVLAVAMTPDGRLAVSASIDKSVRVWDLQTGTQTRQLSGHTQAVHAIALTPDGKLAISGSDDATLRIWDLEGSTKSRLLHDHNNWVNVVAISANGQLAVSAEGGGHIGVPAQKDTSLRVWDVPSGKLIGRLLVNGDLVESLVLLPDGRTVLSASRDGKIAVCDVLAARSQQPLCKNVPGIRSIALSADGRLAISGGGSSFLKVWDLQAERKTTLMDLTQHKGPVASISISRDGETTVTTSKDGGLKTWFTGRGQEAKDFSDCIRGGAIHKTLLTPDQRMAVSLAGACLYAWDVWGEPGHMEYHPLAGHTDQINDAVITPDGKRVLSASKDTSIKIWELATGLEKYTLAGHETSISNIALNQDGSLAVSASQDRVLLWNLANGCQSRPIQAVRGLSTALTFSCDGTRIIAARGTGVKIWDVVDGKEIASIPGHGRLIQSLALTPDGRSLLLADDQDPILWDLEQDRVIMNLKGHTSVVFHLEVTPDGKHAVSAAADGALIVWNLQDGKLEAAFSSDAGGTWQLALTPDGKSLVIGGNGGTVGFLRLEGIPICPVVVTAWSGGSNTGTGSHPVQPAFGCPGCHRWSAIPAAALDSELACPHCGTQVRINPFMIPADWRPIDTAWNDGPPLPPYLQEKDDEEYEPPPL